ncbi:MAG: hypothetical protein R2838_01190 [Caldilineaceae bacterium]
MTTTVAAATPIFWYILAAALALLVPAGLILIGVSGLPGQQAWDSALGALGAWRGGRRLLDDRVRAAIRRHRPGLSAAGSACALVWEWPAVRGLGHGLGHGRAERLDALRRGVTALTYGLFLSRICPG